MADKEKKVKSSEKAPKVEKTEKALKVEKSEKKAKKPNLFVRAGRGIKNFFKTFKGETKKIIWPDRKTILKNTGVVLVMVLVIGVIIFGVDTGLSKIILGVKKLAGVTTEAMISSWFFM